MAIGTGKPAVATFRRTRNPYVLFDKIADTDYTVRVTYLTKNAIYDPAVVDPAVDPEGSIATSRSHIPILPEEYHHVLVLLMGKMMSSRLAGLKNRDGSIRFPGMQEAMVNFSNEYSEALAQAKEKADRRYISRVPPVCNWGGLEISYLSGHPYDR